MFPAGGEVGPEEPTIRDTPLSSEQDRTRVDSRSSSDAGGSSSTTIAETVRVRQRSDHSRLGMLSVTVLLWLGVVSLQFTPNKGLTHWALTAAMVILGAISLRQALWIKADPQRAGRRRVGYMVIALAVTAVFGIAYIGAFTFTVAYLTVLIYFISSSDVRIRAISIYLIGAIGFAGAVLVSYLELIEPIIGIPKDVDPTLVIAAGIAVEIVLAISYVLARRVRRATLSAMRQLERARQEIERRGALLDEANEELVRAMGGVRLGRLSGTKLGRWELGEVLGRGGMGEVYRGASADQEAAIKVLHPHLAEDDVHVARFLREAQILSELKSPQITRILDSGRSTEGGAYLAMELLEGTDLAALLRDRGRLPVDEVLILVSQVAEALSEAEEAGVVHRDLKPQNLMRTGSHDKPAWKILDFGVSALTHGAATLTHGELIGTPGYMSPEQARGDTVDPRSDVFSLGAIVYRSLTGRPAFTGSNSTESLLRVLHWMPERPSDVVPDLRPDIDFVLALALAKERDDRLSSVTSFHAALRDATRGHLDSRLRQAAADLLLRHDWGTQFGAADAEPTRAQRSAPRD